jgi:hypothetical protein
MTKVFTFVVVAALAAFLGLASTALAQGGPSGRIKTGNCSGAADWKLKVKAEDGGIETEFEVDQNRNGRRWRVVLRRNGAVAFRGIRRTLPPSGAFEVRRVFPDGGRIVATATALATGETCRASITA